MYKCDPVLEDKAPQVNEIEPNISADFLAEKLGDLYQGTLRTETDQFPVDAPIYRGCSVTVSECAIAFLSLTLLQY